MFVSPNQMYAVNFASLLIVLTLPNRLLIPNTSSAAENNILTSDIYTPATKNKL